MARKPKVKATKMGSKTLNRLSTEAAFSDLHYELANSNIRASDGGRYSHFIDAAGKHAEQSNAHASNYNRVARAVNRIDYSAIPQNASRNKGSKN